MNYEFHVGDYVETVDGTIGYISSVLATGDAWWVCVSDGYGYYAGQEYSIFCNMNLSCYYKRIGKYDFTKSKEIERAPSSGWCTGVSGDLINKINELVDSVNELMKNNNK